MTDAARRIEDELPVAQTTDRRTVLLALSGRRAPLGAIAMSRLLAGALGAPIHGVFFWPSSLPIAQVPRLLRLTPEALEGIALEVATGDPAEHLTSAADAQPTAFIVVPSDPNASDPLGVGELAFQVLVRSPTGVVVVPPNDAPKCLERILVPLDGTPSTARAIGPAGELARAASASLHVLYVGESGQVPAAEISEPGTMSTPQYVDQPQHEWPAFAKEFVTRFLGSVAHVPKDVRTRLYLGAGPPAQEILRFVDELETHLLVLVWHGQLEHEHGAVFRDVIRAAKCPVLVLKQ